MQAFHNSSMFMLQHIFPRDVGNAFHGDHRITESQNYVGWKRPLRL